MNNRLGFNPAEVKRLPFMEILKRIGPGIIVAGIAVGPGSVTTSAMLGASYGYSLLWLMIPTMFMGITFMLATYRISMLTGMPIIHAIRHYYGKFAAALVGVCLFIACLCFTVGNVSGSGTGVMLMFGIDWKLGALIMIVIQLALYFSKNTYSKVEKGVLFCLAGMIIAFYATLGVAGGPDMNAIGHSLVDWQFPEGAVITSLAFISTNAAIMSGVYGTYLGNEKEWDKRDYFNGVMFADALASVIMVVLIAGAIILVGAMVLHPLGLKIKSAAQLAEMLTPALSAYSYPVMGLALLSAAFAALLGNTQRGIVLFNAGFNLKVDLESSIVRWGCVLIVIFGFLGALLYNGSSTQLIFLANLATSIGTPVAGFFVTLMIWRKDINEGLKQPWLLQISMTISYIFVLAVTILAFFDKL